MRLNIKTKLEKFTAIELYNEDFNVFWNNLNYENKLEWESLTFNKLKDSNFYKMLVLRIFKDVSNTSVENWINDTYTKESKRWKGSNFVYGKDLEALKLTGFKNCYLLVDASVSFGGNHSLSLHLIFTGEYIDEAETFILNEEFDFTGDKLIFYNKIKELANCYYQDICKNQDPPVEFEKLYI